MARPTKLNQKIQERIVESLLLGNYFNVACENAGIAVACGYNWLKRGQLARESGGKTDRAFIEFLDAVKGAQAEAEEEALVQIRAAARTEWTAAAWYLERRYPDRWGRRDRPAVPVDYTKLNDEQLDRIASGEDPTFVLTTPGSSGEGEAPPLASDRVQ